MVNILLCTISRFWTNGWTSKVKIQLKIPARSGGQGLQSVSIKLWPTFTTHMALLLNISGVIKNMVWRKKNFDQSESSRHLAFFQCQWPHIFRKSIRLINDMMIGIIIHNAWCGWALGGQISNIQTSNMSRNMIAHGVAVSWLSISIYLFKIQNANIK